METWDELNQLALLIQRRKDCGYRSHHIFLTRNLPANGTREGYQALARLARAGYFSTILTSNTDTALEDALKEQGSLQYKVFMVGRTPNEQVAEALEGQADNIHIVKLYGHELQAHQASSVSRLPLEIQTSLKSYFSKSIIIVGPMDREEDGLSALHSHRERTIYYVLQHAPFPNDTVVKYLRQQGVWLGNFLITGFYGEFNKFFSTLEKNIIDITSKDQDRNFVYYRVINDSYVSSAHNCAEEDPAITNVIEDPAINDVIKVFYICSSVKSDLELQEEIKKHLSFTHKNWLISGWDIGKLEPGVEREAEIRKQLEDAQVILVLVSVDLISWEVDYLVKRAMQRHNSGNAKVIPIILRPCEWQGAAFGTLTALPDDEKPITLWSNRDEVLQNVAQGVHKVIERLIKR